MSVFQLIERELTDSEYQDILRGFEQHAQEFGNPPEQAERFTFIIEQDTRVVACASCLAYKTDLAYSNYAFLTDLFVEKAFRNQGLGARVLQAIEAKLASRGVRHLWTWTAGYEAPGFYARQGYREFARFAQWYHSGDARVGFCKQLSE